MPLSTPCKAAFTLLIAYVLEPPIVKYTPKFMLGLTMQYLPAVAIMLMDVSVFSKLFSSVTGIRMCQWEMLKAGSRVHHPGTAHEYP